MEKACPLGCLDDRSQWTPLKKNEKMNELHDENIYAYIHEAQERTDQIATFFVATSAVLQYPQLAENARLCASLHGCLGTIIPEVYMRFQTQFEPPSGTSSWRQRRTTLESSLLRNLKKYIQFTSNLVRKPPRAHKLEYQLQKMEAFLEKFADISMKLPPQKKDISWSYARPLG